ncbi:hypothetical protein RRG08_021293 [Elysia crispata]|uniref:Uncharacterized protein n=1 Tax=Elysia crispata TaxID=231223 RepID=A0AAE1DCG5_9GAST|nr:hypothetical protein RRG08_021293 [Elysia crispata]
MLPLQQHNHSSDQTKALAPSYDAVRLVKLNQTLAESLMVNACASLVLYVTSARRYDTGVSDHVTWRKDPDGVCAEYQVFP